MEIAVSNRVIARNDIGQFIRDCEGAATRTVQKSINRGAKLSRQFAPSRARRDPRTIKLKDSIEPRMLSATSGVWVATARHALPIELSAVAHPIPGNPNLGFFWEAAGRMWIPAEYYYHQPGIRDVVNHPGNASQPYLRPAYEAVMAQIMAVAAREYPG